MHATFRLGGCGGNDSGEQPDLRRARASLEMIRLQRSLAALLWQPDDVFLEVPDALPEERDLAAESVLASVFARGEQLSPGADVRERPAILP